MRAAGGERTPPRVGAICADVEVGSTGKGAPPRPIDRIRPQLTGRGETASAVRRRGWCAPPRRRVVAKEEDEAPAGSGGALSPPDLAATGARNLAAVKDAAAISLCPLRCLLLAGRFGGQCSEGTEGWTGEAPPRWRIKRGGDGDGWAVERPRKRWVVSGETDEEEG